MRVGLTALVLLAVVPSSAAASPEARQIVDATMPTPPRCAGVERIVNLPVVMLDGRKLGGVAWAGQCLIHMDETLAPHAYCRVLAHERGHLYGWGHSDDSTLTPTMLPPPAEYAPLMHSNAVVWPACDALNPAPPPGTPEAVQEPYEPEPDWHLEPKPMTYRWAKRVMRRLVHPKRRVTCQEIQRRVAYECAARMRGRKVFRRVIVSDIGAVTIERVL